VEPTKLDYAKGAALAQAEAQRRLKRRTVGVSANNLAWGPRPGPSIQPDFKGGEAIAQKESERRAERLPAYQISERGKQMLAEQRKSSGASNPNSKELPSYKEQRDLKTSPLTDEQKKKLLEQKKLLDLGQARRVLKDGRVVDPPLPQW
jgi:hypothetical protein